MSFGNLDLNIEELPNGVCVVTGRNDDTSDSDSNGAGKSTLFEVISWTIYGRTHKGVGKDSIIKDGTSETYGEVSLEVGSTTVKVIRHKKFNKAEKLEVFIDGEEICDTERLRQTQYRLDEILNISYEKFVNIVYLSSSTYGSFGNSTDKDKKDILQQFVPTIFNTIYDKTSTVYSEVSNELRRLETGKDYLDKSIREAKTNLNNKNEELVKVTSGIDELTIPSEVEVDSEDLLQRITHYTSVIDNVESAKRRLKVLTTELDELEKKILEIGNRPADVCYVCGQEWKDAEKHNFAELEKLTVKYTTLEDKIDKFKDDNKDNLEKNIEDLKSKRRDLQTELKKYNASNKEREEALKTKHKLEGNRESLAKTIEELQSNIVKYEEELSTITQELQDTESKLEVLDIIKTAFSRNGIPAAVLDSILEEIQNRINYYLEQLYNNALSVTINSTRELKSGDSKEEIEFIIRSPKGIRDYKTLSGGEKRRIDVAFILALREAYLTKKDLAFNILVLDEIFDALDVTGGKRILDVLSNTLKVDHVFVVAPTDEYKLLIDNNICVTKSNGNSVLEIGDV